MPADKATPTTPFGRPVEDNQRPFTAGPRGPVPTADTHLVERMAHLNRGRVPERAGRAKSRGAHGAFRAVRDPRGFPVKFRTEHGNRDPGSRPMPIHDAAG